MLPLKKSSSAPALVYLVYQKMSLSNVLPETVRRRGSMTKLFLVFLTLFFFTYISLLFSRYAIQGTDLGFLSASNPLTWIKNPDSSFSLNKELRDDGGRRSSHVSSSARDFVGYESVSILMPAWEVLLIVSPEAPPLLKAPVGGGGDGGGLYCLFSNNATSEARYAGVLPFTNRTSFKCEMPKNARRQRPYIQPVLTESPAVVVQSSPSVQESQANKKEMIRNTFFVYESLSTENDVILFVKGVNHRQGINRTPDEFRCVFEDGQKTTVKTAVTSSVQEVFRCHHPDLTAFGPNTNTNIKVSLEIATENRAVPSVALYAPTTATTAPARRTIVNREPKKLLCACTMVYNVAKYLREWVTYYSKLGVEKFILYDNDSDDNLTEIVNELNRDGFDVTTLLWLWPKTQEAGFSHNAVFSNDTCRWMMYMDVDEFVFAPSWINESQPSDQLLRSLYLNEKSLYVGQVSFRCNDFGPSDQLTHPVEGVTQGYTCHRWVAQQRHKSIVLLDAVDDSLVNVVHHFGLKRGFRWKHIGPESAVVNHYKYQAWPEFKAKFRRRVSAYVVDWRESLNPKSKDRTPGLGFEPVEPKGWSKMFCDIRDDRLKLLTRKWFGIGTGSKMVWQQRRR
ncbi:hypothetical protein Dsin_003886 [Dipteronia sinensis]|uniref:Glycosyltransferase family 92 protein n=1 Tax=Dipteronia sinensis TaxID=43782 RepID=A0AAE0B9S2_9ROSI|nr:hypothetical protein Dsin_003886 [Dipteronia sinensis]